MKTTRIISFVLASFLALSAIPITALANAEEPIVSTTADSQNVVGETIIDTRDERAEADSEKAESDGFITGFATSEQMIASAQNELEMLKTSIPNPEILGFAADEIAFYQLGNPFSIIVLDDDANLALAQSNETTVFPIMYSDQVRGIMEVYYDANSGTYTFTYGKAYADELNEVQADFVTSINEPLMVARMGDKLFATDGEKTEILSEQPVEGIATASFDDVLSAASSLSEELTSRPELVVRSIKNNEHAIEEGSVSAITPRYTPTGLTLSVPHVTQTGVCGVAAWAAVLNYRSGTRYTNATLQTAMTNGGHVNGSGGIPNMTDYRNFAQASHRLTCSLLYSPPSFSTVQSAINAGRPIMGSWLDGSAGHAIIIAGYSQTSGGWHYYLKNPWYSYQQTISVSNSSSVYYNDSGYNWVLSQSVY